MQTIEYHKLQPFLFSPSLFFMIMLSIFFPFIKFESYFACMFNYLPVLSWLILFPTKAESSMYSHFQNPQVS